MVGKIVCWTVAFGCAALFYGIGVYAQRLQRPMSFWAGRAVDPATVTDTPAYNRENGIMWKRYSLWYAAAGVAEIWSEIAFLAILVLSATLGLALLIRSYRRICKKYST